MELGWFETIQLLGLDVMGAVALVMLALDGLIDATRFATRAIGRVGIRKTRTRAAEPPADAWPPKEWRPSH